MLSSPDKDLQMRGATIVRHVVGHSKSLAEQILDPEVMEVMEVVAKLGKDLLSPEVESAIEPLIDVAELPEYQSARQHVLAALEMAEKWKVIEKKDSDDES